MPVRDGASAKPKHFCKQLCSLLFAPHPNVADMKTLSGVWRIIAFGSGMMLSSLGGCFKGPQAPPKTVEIQADDKMRYDVTAFEAKPGQKISVTFKNVGTAPKQSMGHNFVLLDRTITTVNVQKFLDVASSEAEHDYVPGRSRDVLAHSKLLGPNETEVVTFNAPFVAGDYLYVCSFPGHYSQGTKGVMTVK